MTLLNLGCGTVTSDEPGVVNIDRSIYLRLRQNRLLRPIIPLVVRGHRREKLNSLPDNILVHDLSRGIPFDTATVDAVYHSHMLPHLDRDVAEELLREVARVLKPGGIHRIVVPDFEMLCDQYLRHFAKCERDPDERANHDEYISRILEMSVRKEAYGSRDQPAPRRFAENLLLGDARGRGETVQWMYDRISLSTKLIEAGFGEVHIQDYLTSLIPEWSKYGLDTHADGTQSKLGSLYIEGVR